MAGREDALIATGHIGPNTPKFVPPHWGRPRFDPTQTWLCKFGWVWSSLTLEFRRKQKHQGNKNTKEKKNRAVQKLGVGSKTNKSGVQEVVRARSSHLFMANKAPPTHTHTQSFCCSLVQSERGRGSATDLC